MWPQFERLITEDRLAHAYIVEGDPAGAADQFAHRVIAALYGQQEGEEAAALARMAEEGSHPDISVVEPESKSRQILTKQIDGEIHRLHQTAYEGGWKVLIIRYAELMNQDAANKFLKTLEEPPAGVLILLLSNAADAILTTIRSRCQLVRLEAAGGGHDAAWMPHMKMLLHKGWGRSLSDRAGAAEDLQALLDVIKKQAVEATELEFADDESVDKKRMEARAESRYKAEAEHVMRSLESWCRDLLMVKLSLTEETAPLVYPDDRQVLEVQAERLSVKDCYKLIERVEKTARRVLFGNLPIEATTETAYL